MERFVVVSDIHGNRWALEAVLESLERDRIAEVFNLGDTLYGPLDPRGTAAILAEKDWPTVRGNQDRLITDPEADLSPTERFVHGQLGAEQLAWLRALPETLSRDDVLMCHASPDSDTTYLLWDIDRHGARLRRQQDVAGAFFGVHHRLILCGHDHTPRIMFLDDGRTIVNPGSVGLPAYSDDEPFFHVMQTGAPHARYAVVTRASQGWAVDDRAVPYDWRAAVTAAKKNGRPDWAAWLATGRGD